MKSSHLQHCPTSPGFFSVYIYIYIRICINYYYERRISAKKILRWEKMFCDSGKISGKGSFLGWGCKYFQGISCDAGLWQEF